MLEHAVRDDEVELLNPERGVVDVLLPQLVSRRQALRPQDVLERRRPDGRAIDADDGPGAAPGAPENLRSEPVAEDEHVLSAGIAVGSRS